MMEKSTNSEFIEKVKAKRQKLDDVREILKKKFIGIDQIIDQIIDNISIWYLMPELQTRPLIISLWGTTGVGKTDLVRTLVKLLEFNDKFVEIQLDMKNSYIKTIQRVLNNTSIEPKDPSILLLDEMQRFRTIDETGRMIDNEYFNDIWMLLSDGKFQSDSQNKNDIFQLMMSEIYWQQCEEDDKDPEDKESKPIEGSSCPKIENSVDAPVSKKKKERKFKTTYWSAMELKKLLKLDMSVEDVMKLSSDERILIIKSHIDRNDIYEGDSYEKMLIFVSGNLDEAFQMADDVEDVELDADIYHEFSKKINIIDIKKALATKFKPEQIARFGNIHIIYPVLNKDSYQKIIKKRTSEILNNIKKAHNIEITLTENVYNTIYRNGVYPTQGVRPVLSTISHIIDNSLPFFLFNAMEKNIESVIIDYNNEKLSTTINGELLEKPILLNIENIKKSRSLDEKDMVLVHELGHAMVYTILNEISPTQININSVSLGNGFMASHKEVEDKTSIKNEICVGMAGQVMEEIVFGDEHKSSGCRSDILNATFNASQYVRHLGMGDTISNINNRNNVQLPEANYDIDPTNIIIENIISNEKKRAKDLLMNNIHIFKKLVEFARNYGKIDISDYSRICEENGLKATIKSIEEKLTFGYSNKLDDFLKN